MGRAASRGIALASALGTAALAVAALAQGGGPTVPRLGNERQDVSSPPHLAAPFSNLVRMLN